MVRYAPLFSNKDISMSAGDREVTWVTRRVQMADGTFEEKSVPQSSDGFLPGISGERSYRCVVCGLAFKANNVVMFRGKPYGVPCGDSKDIKSILLEERADRFRSRIRDNNVR